MWAGRAKIGAAIGTAVAAIVIAGSGHLGSHRSPLDERCGKGWHWHPQDDALCMRDPGTPQYGAPLG